MMLRFHVLLIPVLLAGCHSQPGIVRADDPATSQALDAAGDNISERDGRGAHHAPILRPSLGQRMNDADSAPR